MGNIDYRDGELVDFSVTYLVLLFLVLLFAGIGLVSALNAASRPASCCVCDCPHCNPPSPPDPTEIEGSVLVIPAPGKG